MFRVILKTYLIKYIMAFQNQYHSFLTPDKRFQPDRKLQEFSTAAPYALTSRTNKNHSFTNNHMSEQEREKDKESKIVWLEQRVKELKRYLVENDRIDRNIIKKMFDWGSEIGEGTCEEKLLLKELSNKVQGLIKENHNLKKKTYHEEFQQLKKQNQKLSALLKSPGTRQAMLDEENKYLRNYINEHQNTLRSSVLSEAKNVYMPQLTISSEKSQMKDEFEKELNKIEMLLSEERYYNKGQSVKKYITNYINLCAEELEDRVREQDKHIEGLETRIKRVQDIEKKIQSYNFQKKVKMQESMNKSKIRTVKTHQIKGEDDENVHFQGEEPAEQKNVQRKLVFSRLQPINEPISEAEQLICLREKCMHLEFEYRALREKYEFEISNHITNANQQEEYINTIHRLKSENKQLREKEKELSFQLEINTNKLNDLENYTLRQTKNGSYAKNITVSKQVESELKSIRQQIAASCSLEKLEDNENLMAQLLLQRNSLRRQLDTMQRGVLDGSKFSGIHKQLFKLKERVSYLEQLVDFYLQKIKQCQKQHSLFLEDEQRRLAKDISRDIREMSLDDEAYRAGMRWQRSLKNTLRSSLTRLKNIENTICSESE